MTYSNKARDLITGTIFDVVNQAAMGEVEGVNGCHPGTASGHGCIDPHIDTIPAGGPDIGDGCEAIADVIVCFPPKGARKNGAAIPGKKVFGP